MVRIMKKDGNRLEGIGERIDVRLTLIEEALGKGRNHCPRRDLPRGDRRHRLGHRIPSLRGR